MGNKSRIEVQLTATESGLSAVLRKGEQQLLSFTRQAQNAVQPFTSLVSSAFGLKSALAGIISVGGITALSTSLIRAGVETTNTRAAFLAISGSSQKAGEEMAFVGKVADQLGLNLQTATQDYKSIAAAAKGSTLEGKGVQSIFTAVAKASTTLGLSADNTSGALLAVSQMISKGKVSAEELRGQLGERLPGAFQIAATAMGVTTGELDKMMQNGTVMATDFLPKFAAALEQSFGKGAVVAATGFSAGMNRIGTELFKLKGGLGEAVTNNKFFVVALSYVSGALGALSKDVSKNSGSWRQWAKESALSLLQFAVDSADGLNTVYKGLSFLAGSLKLAFVGAVTLGKGFMYLFEKANELIGDPDKAKYWADAQKGASEIVENALNGAAESFRNAEQGSTGLQNVSKRVGELREQLSKVKPDQIVPTEATVAQAQTQLKKVGDTWINVQTEMVNKTKSSSAASATEIAGGFDTIINTMLQGGAVAVNDAEKKIKSLAGAIKEVNPMQYMAAGAEKEFTKIDGTYQDLQKDIKTQTAETTEKNLDKWDQFATEWAANLAEKADKVSEKLDEMAKPRTVEVTIKEIAAHATGGLIQRFARGGRLSGYGGGDRISALLEAGEYVVRKEAVAKFGAGLFNQLNSLQLPTMPIMAATGGGIGLSEGSSPTYNLTLNYSGPASQSSARDMAKMVMGELQKMHRGRS